MPSSWPFPSFKWHGWFLKLSVSTASKGSGSRVDAITESQGKKEEWHGLETAHPARQRAARGTDLCLEAEAPSYLAENSPCHRGAVGPTLSGY